MATIPNLLQLPKEDIVSKIKEQCGNTFSMLGKYALPLAIHYPSVLSTVGLGTATSRLYSIFFFPQKRR